MRKKKIPSNFQNPAKYNGSKAQEDGNQVQAILRIPLNIKGEKKRHDGILPEKKKTPAEFCPLNTSEAILPAKYVGPNFGAEGFFIIALPNIFIKRVDM